MIRLPFDDDFTARCVNYAACVGDNERAGFLAAVISGCDATAKYDDVCAYIKKINDRNLIPGALTPCNRAAVEEGFRKFKTCSEACLAYGMSEIAMKECCRGCLKGRSNINQNEEEEVFSVKASLRFGEMVEMDQRDFKSQHPFIFILNGAFICSSVRVSGIAYRECVKGNNASCTNAVLQVIAKTNKEHYEEIMNSAELKSHVESYIRNLFDTSCFGENPTEAEISDIKMKLERCKVIIESGTANSMNHTTISNSAKGKNTLCSNAEALSKRNEYVEEQKRTFAEELEKNSESFDATELHSSKKVPADAQVNVPPDDELCVTEFVSEIPADVPIDDAPVEQPAVSAPEAEEKDVFGSETDGLYIREKDFDHFLVVKDSYVFHDLAVKMDAYCKIVNAEVVSVKCRNGNVYDRGLLVYGDGFPELNIGRAVFVPESVMLGAHLEDFLCRFNYRILTLNYELLSEMAISKGTSARHSGILSLRALYHVWSHEKTELLYPIVEMASDAGMAFTQESSVLASVFMNYIYLAARFSLSDRKQEKLRKMYQIYEYALSTSADISRMFTTDGGRNLTRKGYSDCDFKYNPKYNHKRNHGTVLTASVKIDYAEGPTLDEQKHVKQMICKLAFHRYPYLGCDWTLLYLRNGAAAVYVNVRTDGKDTEFSEGLNEAIADTVKIYEIKAKSQPVLSYNVL